MKGAPFKYVIPMTAQFGIDYSYKFRETPYGTILQEGHHRFGQAIATPNREISPIIPDRLISGEEKPPVPLFPGTAHFPFAA
jgi:hypothetical protein